MARIGEAKRRIEESIITQNPILNLNHLGLEGSEDVLKLLIEATHITELHLNHNQITDYSFLQDLKELHTLYLSHNKIEDYSFLQDLKELHTLYLNNNKIEDYSFLQDLKELHTLNLSNNKIEDISFLKDLKELHTLYLNNNKIEDISFLKDLKELHTLNLSNNKIEDYSFLQDLKELHTLNLNNNKIEDISFLKDLKELHTLNLSSNKIEDISVLELLPNLKELSLKANPVERHRITKQLIEENIKAQSPILNLNGLSLDGSENVLKLLIEVTHITELNLSQNKIEDYSFLQDLQQLHTLNLSNNKIENISVLQDLQQLQSLNLNNNQIEGISFLQDLKALQSLNLSQNKIEDYSFLQDLKALQSLSLSQNKIEDISFLQDLKALQSLNLSSNKIEDVSFLQDLKELHTLNLNQNKIVDLEPLTGLTKLRSLYLIQNKLKNVSLKQLNKFSNLETLVLKDNPIENIPKEFFNNSSVNVFRGVKSYLIAQAEGQIINITSKLILFGNGEAGKTTLSHQLRRNKFEQYDERTHGILVKKWTIKEGDFSDDLKEKLNQIYKEIKQDEPESEVEMPKEITLDLWDFGGQEYYHATHRLFLTNNVLYLLVWDIETNQQVEIEDDLYYPLGYWRENIKNNASKSRILEIQNKVKGKYDIDHENLKYKVNFRDKNNEKSLKRYETDIEDLKEGIFNQLHHLEHLGSGFPKVYDDIRQALSEKEAPFLSFTEYTKLCQDTDQTKKKIMQEGSQVETLTKFLHDTGAIICYRFNEKKHKNIERLKNYVFIKPTWVTDAIYAIFSKKVKKENGEFKFKHIRKSLKNHADKLKKKGEEFPKLAPKVWLELLNAFELVFENEKKSSYIVPQYLPLEWKDTRVLNWALKDKVMKHCFTLHFPNYLAKSLFLRFISEFGTQHIDDLYWKNGLVFSWEKKTVFSSCDYEARKISIQVQDGDKEVARDMLSFFLDKINQNTLISLSETEGKVNLEKLQEKIDLGKQEIEDTEGNTLDVKYFEHLFRKQIDMKKIKIFVSYSHKAEKYKDDIIKHLRSLKLQGLIEGWTDRSIEAGEWDGQIKQAMEETDIFFLMVEPDFLNSDYIASVEVRFAFEQYQKGKVKIYPIICDSCDWTIYPMTNEEKYRELHPVLKQEMLFWMGKLQAFPKNSKPIRNWENPNDAYQDVIESLKKAITKM
jgi:Leucine-rich repeat (LRR) protein/GTPase SAR1 family protein